MGMQQQFDGDDVRGDVRGDAAECGRVRQRPACTRVTHVERCTATAESEDSGGVVAPPKNRTEISQNKKKRF